MRLEYYYKPNDYIASYHKIFSEEEIEKMPYFPISGPDTLLANYQKFRYNKDYIKAKEMQGLAIEKGFELRFCGDHYECIKKEHMSIKKMMQKDWGNLLYQSIFSMEKNSYFLTDKKGKKISFNTAKTRLMQGHGVYLEINI